MNGQGGSIFQVPRCLKCEGLLGQCACSPTLEVMLERAASVKVDPRIGRRFLALVGFSMLAWLFFEEGGSFFWWGLGIGSLLLAYFFLWSLCGLWIEKMSGRP